MIPDQKIKLFMINHYEYEGDLLNINELLYDYFFGVTNIYIPNTKGKLFLIVKISLSFFLFSILHGFTKRGLNRNSRCFDPLRCSLS